MDAAARLLRDQCDDPCLLAEVMTVQSLVLMSHGDHERAAELLTDTLDLQQVNGNRSGEANTLGNLTHCYVVLGRLIEAINASALGTDAVSTTR